MPRDQPVRWESSELIKVLGYIDKNFDMWFSSHTSACIKVIEVTGSKRDAKSIYNKVHALMKAMDEFITTGKKSSTNAIIWEDSNIHDLVRSIHTKNKERKKKDEENKETNKNRSTDGDGDIEMGESTDQVTAESSSRISQAPFSNDAVYKLFDEKIQQIDKLRSELTELAKNTNSAFAKINAQQDPYSIDMVNTKCDEKAKQISQLRDELLLMIENANNKYEKLKSFQ